MTKAQARAIVQQLIDDPNAARWSATNIDLLLQLTIDPIWTQIFQADPNYLYATERLTALTTPGYVNLASGGDLTYRFFRVRSIVRDGQEYGPTDQRNIVMENSELITGRNYSYLKQGSKLYLFPFDLTTDLDFSYNYKPETLSTMEDTETIVWPDGHEGVFIFAAAAKALRKGAAEDPAGMLEESDRLKYLMLAEIEKYYPGPNTVFSADSSVSYGGE